ncbi:MAG: hypothetical protein J6J35_01405 [Alphaproteobacteria bacterium]|nr:hypothetical protein [Alphaproteobacteria bacterium]
MYILKIFIKNEKGAYVQIKKFELSGKLDNEARTRGEKIAKSHNPNAIAYFEEIPADIDAGRKLKEVTRGM